MSTKDTANKELNRMYGSTLEKIRTERDQRTGADTQRRTSIVIPAEETARKKAAAAAFEQQEAEAERQRALAAEADFRAEEQRKYLAAGGTEDSFNMNWPRLRQEIVERRYLAQPDKSSRTVAQRVLDAAYKRP